MKKILLVMSVVLVSMACVAEDRPVVSEQLPAPAREFLNANYPGEKISYAVVDGKSGLYSKTCQRSGDTV